MIRLVNKNGVGRLEPELETPPRPVVEVSIQGDASQVVQGFASLRGGLETEIEPVIPIRPTAVTCVGDRRIETGIPGTADRHEIPPLGQRQTDQGIPAAIVIVARNQRTVGAPTGQSDGRVIDGRSCDVGGANSRLQLGKHQGRSGSVVVNRSDQLLSGRIAVQSRVEDHIDRRPRNTDLGLGSRPQWSLCDRDGDRIPTDTGLLGSESELDLAGAQSAKEGRNLRSRVGLLVEGHNWIKQAGVGQTGRSLQLLGDGPGRQSSRLIKVELIQVHIGAEHRHEIPRRDHVDVPRIDQFHSGQSRPYVARILKAFPHHSRGVVAVSQAECVPNLVKGNVEPASAVGAGSIVVDPVDHDQIIHGAIDSTHGINRHCRGDGTRIACGDG